MAAPTLANWKSFWSGLKADQRRLLITKGLSDPATPEQVWKAWILVAPRTVRTRLAQMGIRGADDDHGIVRSNRQSQDISDSILAQTAAEDYSDPIIDQMLERFDIERETACEIFDWTQELIARAVEAEHYRVVRQVTALVLNSHNLKITTGGLLFAADLARVNGFESQAAYARSINVTRSAICKETKRIQRLLNLRPNSHLRSEAAAEACSVAQKMHHWRHKIYGQS